MNSMKKIIIVAVFLVSVSVIYISRPDYGGISRCERIFEVEGLNGFNLVQKRIFPWKFFELPKFQFVIDKENSRKFMAYLKSEGFVSWVEGGLQHGSIVRGWSQSDDLIYCKKQVGGGSIIWSYEESSGRVVALLTQR